MIDQDYLRKTLLELAAIPSPSGFTDEIVRYVCGEIGALGYEYELTRRGMVRALIPGRQRAPARAVVTHLDTTGAMVRAIEPHGRLAVAPIGHWSARFAEGVAATVFTRNGALRSCMLPKVEWGVSRDDGVAAGSRSWDDIELRLEEPVFSAADVASLGVEVGDYVALDPQINLLDNGYVVGRNLDNKAGAAAVLAFLRAFAGSEQQADSDTYFLFTISEVTGGGIGSAVLPEISELVTVDFESVPAVEKSPYKRVTLASGDASGPYDFHLTAHLRELAAAAEPVIPLQQKYLMAYHSDAAAALIAGHDVRTAVIAYAGDAAHSLERTHLDSLTNVARLLEAYVTSAPTFSDDEPVKSVENFSHQIDVEQLPRTSRQLPDTAEIIRRTMRESEVLAAEEGAAKEGAAQKGAAEERESED